MCLPKLEPLVMVSRETWGAKPPKDKGLEMMPPIQNVIISFNSDTEKGETLEECSRIMRDLQKRNMEEEGLSDVAYNFVVGGDGRLYEGRGWMVQPDTKKLPEFDGRRLDIAYMGNLNRNELTWEMLKAALQLFRAGVESKLLMEEYNAVEDPQTIYLDMKKPQITN